MKVILSLVFFTSFIFLSAFELNAKNQINPLPNSVKEEDKIIRIGSKKFTESVILGELLAQVIENISNIQVERKFFLGGTSIAFNAIESNEIDVYPDYTGTLYNVILKGPKTSDQHSINEFLRSHFEKTYDLLYSPGLGFNNSYGIAVRRDDPRFSKIKNLSDLKEISPSINIGSPPEFLERKDGFAELTAKYQTQFQKENVRSIESGLSYLALKNQKLDSLVIYTTDGRIQRYDFKVLKDNLNFFPPYKATYVYRKLSGRREKILSDAIAMLSNQINEREMQNLNERVDKDKLSPFDAAREFLIGQNIIRVSSNQKQTKSAQPDLIQRTMILAWQHIQISLLSLFFALIVSLPLAIFMVRNQQVAKFLFPIVNTLQTIPSLALLGLLVPIVGIGLTPAIITLVMYSILPIVHSTYIGLKTVGKDHREVALTLGLTPRQSLYHIELPIALPTIFSGIRTAGVILIGTATLVALIGAGGLGEPIFRGLSTINSQLVLSGAIPTALIAIIFDRSMLWLERKIVSKGLKIDQENLH